MKPQESSDSAAIIAAHRAFDSEKPADQRICHDQYARQLAGPGFTVIGEVDFSQETALELFNSLVPGMHEYFVARTRYIDDTLKQSIENGLEQLVVLGAGYDSRAYRFGALKQQTRVFEVDHPATQQVKKERIKGIFKTLPGHVTYIQEDFQEGTLADSLSANGYDRGLKTLFIWEGVTMYIDAGAVDTILAFIAENSGPGSSVIFDFTFPDVVTGSCERPEAQFWLKRSEEKREPLMFGIDPEELKEFLSARGFQEIICVGSDFFNSAYFTGIHQDRAATPILSIVHATVTSG